MANAYLPATDMGRVIQKLIWDLSDIAFRRLPSIRSGVYLYICIPRYLKVWGAWEMVWAPNCSDPQFSLS